MEPEYLTSGGPGHTPITIAQQVWMILDDFDGYRNYMQLW